MAGYVAVLQVDLHFPDAGSLKAKRKDLQSIKAILRGRYGAAVSETDHHDSWQRATVTVALTGPSASELDHYVDEVERYLDGRCPQGVGVRRTLLSVDELADVVTLGVRVSPSSGWEG